jgi:two-component SAPR family response regulator
MLRFSSLAKITQPSYTGVYPRERLYKSLDQALNKQAVWISGPPGSGKTSFVSSYLKSRNIKNLWYQVDEGDADIATFFYYMRLAVPRVTPRRGTPLPLLTPEFLGGVLAFTRRYCQNLYKRLDPPFILIFDNYHEVPEESSFHEVIRTGVNELPKDAHVIFISRLEPPPILARFRANEIMATISWNELQLSEEEFRGIIKLKNKMSHSSDQLHILHEKTQGWVAGLILMLEQARLKDIPLQDLNKNTPEDIIDYFAGEIFHNLDTTTQGILLKTTFLPRMTIKMANELCGSEFAGQLISNMSQNNIFTTRYIQPEPEYQYHPLFREFLLAQAQKLLSSDDLHSVQQEAAILLEIHGMVEDAIVLLRDSKIWPELVTLILKWAAYLVENGRTQTLEESLSRIPSHILDESPWLLYWLGVCRQPYEPRISQDYLERAFSNFRSLQDPIGTYMAWCEIGITIQYDEAGNYNHLDSWISTLDELMNEFPEFPSPEIHDRVATVMFIALTMHMPQHPLMDAWEKRVLTVFRTSGKPRVQAEIGAYLSLYHLMSGNTFKAEIEASTLRGLAQSKEAPAIAMVLGRTAEALYYWRVGQFEDCLQTVSAGLEVSDQTGVHLWDFLQLGTGLSCVLSMGNLDAAQEYIEKMAPDMDGPRRLVVCYYRYLASWDAYLRGDFNNALQHTENALQAAIETGVPYFEGLTNLASAIVQRALDKREESIDYIDKAMRLSIHIKSQILEYMCLLTESQFALDEGNDKGLRKSLVKALEIGRKNNYTNFSWWLSSSMTQLCSKALEYGIETDYVKYLIKKRNLIPEPSLYEINNWPWEIKVFTLGRFEILKQDTRLSFTRKAQKKPLELLKFVLTCGGKDIPEEKITGTLWPDAEGDSAHRSFASAMHRLRKLLGNDPCIKLVDGKVSLDPRYFWVDYWGLERLLDKVENIDKSNNMDESEYMQIFQKIMSLYQGVFLPGDTEIHWTMTMRDRLRSRFINYIGKTGQELEQSENWDMAIDLYNKGLETDNLAEKFYRNLMNCYLKINMKAEGLAVYQRCKTLLSVVLGSTPSDATESVHKLLSKLT